MRKFLLHCLLLLIATDIALAQASPSNSHAVYMANEGLMVVNGDTKILFDPLFRNNYGHYQLLPKAMEDALFAGRPPFDGIDAIFISHYHGDHFSPVDILRLLKIHTDIRLYAPAQAVAGLREQASSQDQAVFERVIAVDLAYKDAPVTLEMAGLLIEAVRIPHSGWPTIRGDVENISWRVTLNERTTVLHMGDADANDIHFATDPAHWEKTHLHMAFPPYWFFSSAAGRDILNKRLKPDHSVGVHVPFAIPTDPAGRPAELRSVDLFTQPGERRDIPASGTQ